MIVNHKGQKIRRVGSGARRTWVTVKDNRTVTATDLTQKKHAGASAVVWIERVEKHPLTKLAGWLIAIFSAWVLWNTYDQIQQDLLDRREERAARQEERIDRAWTRLQQRAGGDIGKGYALNTLINAGVSLQTLDLSCAAIAKWDPQRNICESRAVFSNIGRELGVFPDYEVYLGEAEMAYTDRPNSIGNLNLLSMSSAILQYSDLRSMYFNSIKFDNIWIFASNMRDTVWFSDTRIVVVGSGLAHSSFSGALKESRIERSDVTGIVVADENFSEVLATDTRNKNWAWADQPPMLSTKFAPTRRPVRKILERIMLCDPRVRTEMLSEKRDWTRFFEDGPRFAELSPWEEARDRCVELSIETAATRFPDVYKNLNIEH
ncbi:MULTISPECIES: hypothetical protein [unclassified Ensifer]|uniref:hypothetical protein n=1 Tax=unclassified Ensifer TaxID=2633371 RepID=UPI0030103B96